MHRKAICYSGYPSVVRKWQACVLDEADCSCLLVSTSVCVHVCVCAYIHTYILCIFNLVGSGFDV